MLKILLRARMQEFLWVFTGASRKKKAQSRHGVKHQPGEGDEQALALGLFLPVSAGEHPQKFP